MQARYYDPVLGRFLSNDPVGFVDSGLNPQMFGRYTYGLNDPVNLIDPDGRAAETLWDAANVVTGLISAGANVNDGNYGAAAIDLVGVALDGAATVVPFVPGGAAAGIKVSREAKKVTQKSLKKLKPLHSKETIGDRPDLAKLSDDELMESVTNPKNGDMVKESTTTGKLSDGNSRVTEMQKRAADPNSSIAPDTKIPVESHTPDNSMFEDF